MDSTVESFILKRLEPGAGTPASSSLYCREFLAHYENFTVGSLLFPAHLRDDLAAIYAFSRFSDDLADEPGERPADLPADQEIPFRLARLDHWTRLVAGLPETADKHPILAALEPAIRRHGFPRELFLDLLDAFRQDLLKTRHPDRDSLLDYCRRSADPVGRLVLRLFGLDRPELDRLSDRICTALQLANFWQDLSRDLAAGRCFLPLDSLAAQGLTPDMESLRAHPERLAPVLQELIRWTGQLFDEGAPLVNRVPRRLGLELRLFLGGGRAILGQVERLGVDILWQRPHLGRPRKLGIGLAALAATLFRGR